MVNCDVGLHELEQESLHSPHRHACAVIPQLGVFDVILHVRSQYQRCSSFNIARKRLEKVISDLHSDFNMQLNNGTVLGSEDHDGDGWVVSLRGPWAGVTC